MTRTAAWLCGLLLGFLWVLPTVVMSTPAELCKTINTVNTSLNFIGRRQHMKHYFPINYTIRVHYEEIFRVHNISRLRARVQGLEARELQNLWLLVNQQVLKRILRVLPERHPSHKYTSDLEKLFRMVQQVFQQVFQQQQLGPQGEEREPPERIQEILDRMSDPDVKEWKSVRPKALLDNCYRTMHCLFEDCFQSNEKWESGRTEHKVLPRPVVSGQAGVRSVPNATLQHYASVRCHGDGLRKHSAWALCSSIHRSVPCTASPDLKEERELLMLRLPSRTHLV